MVWLKTVPSGYIFVFVTGWNNPSGIPSQRSLPLPDLYKLHNLLHLNLFRGATDPEHKFFVIDTTGRHWEHDLMTQFLQQQLLKNRDGNLPVRQRDPTGSKWRRHLYRVYSPGAAKRVLSFTHICALCSLNSQSSVNVSLLVLSSMPWLLPLWMGKRRCAHGMDFLTGQLGVESLRSWNCFGGTTHFGVSFLFDQFSWNQEYV